MSTSAPVSESTGLDLAVKTENVTYDVYVKLNDKQQVDEKETTYRARLSDDKKEEAAVKALTDKGFQLAFTKTVKTYKAGSLEGFSEIIGDPEEALNVANRGMAAKFNQKIKDVLTDFDAANQTFSNAAGDDVYDSRELLQEATQKRSLTQSEKIVRDLRKSNLSDEQIARMIQVLQSSSSNQ